MEPFVFRGAVVALTGAASGIGRAVALNLAAEGCTLALADRDAAGLERTALEARELGVEVSATVLDVAARAEVDAWAEACVRRHGGLSLLICNAGVALGGTIEQVSVEDIAWLMGVNFWGVVHCVKAFLPALKQRPGAHVAVLSSVYGLVAPAGHAAYAASKFAVRGFAEALRHELAEARVGVSIVHPGGVDTAIARNARVGTGADASQREDEVRRFSATARTSPEQAAEVILRGIRHREPRILIGRDARQLDRLQRLMPVKYWGVIARHYARPGASRS
jgi:NADP-dependent 3-hydroxy acid dehydrogenase YdfG